MSQNVCKVCKILLNHENSYIKTTTNLLCKTHWKSYDKLKTAIKKYELKNNKTEKRRLQFVNITKRMREKFPEKWEARLKVREAIRKGKLKRMPCEICKDTIKIQAHHNNYLEPLEVIWLCKKHHEHIHHH